MIFWFAIYDMLDVVLSSLFHCQDVRNRRLTKIHHLLINVRKGFEVSRHLIFGQGNLGNWKNASGQVEKWRKCSPMPLISGLAISWPSKRPIPESDTESKEYSQEIRYHV